ncbi:MAG: hypothetical protein SOZ95_05350 [Bacilli bacterium]|nr:hypothetical protein [Lachnospiraceae bacterium]MDY3801439.1 hypothetical protein [Bacilli bacterium]
MINKKIKYFIMSFMLIMVCILSINISGISVNAKDNLSDVSSFQIIKKYNPNTVLSYNGCGNWKEVMMYSDEGGFYEVNLDDFESEKSSSCLDENCYEQIMPNPVCGMRVYYDNWGEVEKVMLPTKLKLSNLGISSYALDSNIEINANALPAGKRKAKGTYKYGSVVQNTKDKYGYTCNKISISDNSVVGTGDFTVFTDKKGDHDNILQKGDCATKGSIDNPLKGTKIKVTNKTNGITYTFTKNDNGSLPNAIIDIWKTGVTNLGIDSKNYDNIKKAGKYTYKFK